MLTGPNGLTLVALLAAAFAAGYGAWRFWRAYRLTGCRLSLMAAAISCLAPLSAFAIVSFERGASGIQAALPATGLVAAAGFGLSRTRWLAPMTLGLWLPPALNHWREGEGGPLASLLAAVLGGPAAAHASRTAALVESLAEPLSVPPEDTDDLVIAALLHGIGGALPASLAAGCPQSAAARAGAVNLLRRVPHCRQVAAIVAAAGERWDGSGPLGLSGESLPLASRIIAVAEAFDRAAEDGLATACAAIRGGSATAYDPVVVSELLHVYRDRSGPAAA